MKTNNELLRDALSISMDINKAYAEILKTSDPSQEKQKIKELYDLSIRISKTLEALTEDTDEQR